MRLKYNHILTSINQKVLEHICCVGDDNIHNTPKQMLSNDNPHRNWMNPSIPNSSLSSSLDF